ncbi:MULTISPECIES: DNA recombination protein RmuC [Acidiphilium]|uniref:DNA recombination protein RmuC homolog n=1 Tax=Acidiphilium iwatense TaxID=768198 RepID=A0ABS9DSV1_9PROT|nr:MULTISPECIES: DNA recombination protein RmuC [Acidiphilium]MCF3945816.1 DNA recombination protein RmuC [Acidiphilium iwatense]
MLLLLVLLALAVLSLQSRRIAGLSETLRSEIAEQSRAGLITAFERVQEGARAQNEQLGRLHGAIGDLSLLMTEKLAEAERAAQTGRAQALNETLAVIARLTDSQTQLADRMGRDFGGFSVALREEQEKLRGRVEQKLDEMRAGNEAKLEAMRLAVDEQLQSALEKRIGESFQRVADQFAQVQQAIGQVQNVATQVGDLKRLFANVKSRGGWGEAQIRQTMEDTLPPGTFEANFKADPNSAETVEFALRMPVREGEQPVYLPIDAKFPTEDYDRLLLASEAADRVAEEIAIVALGARIRAEAKKIAQKYIRPPRTTDIAVLYLPSEGLFAEVARIPGLIEQIQRETRVLIQSPSLLPALLHTIRVGHFTVQLERKAGEIGKILSAVKAEWGKLGDTMEKLAKRSIDMSGDIEKTQIRIRAVGRTLRAVEAVDYIEAAPLLGIEAAAEE